MWQEFKDFAFKGNAFDLAVGVIMGGAFGKIVDSMVGDLIMPIVGYLSGGSLSSLAHLPQTSRPPRKPVQHLHTVTSSPSSSTSSFSLSSCSNWSRCRTA